MLDIKFIRENADLVKLAAQKKKIVIDIDRLLTIDDERREIMTRLETQKASQNKVADFFSRYASETEGGRA